MKSTAPISLDSTVGPTRDQVSCDVSGEAVILNVASGQYYGLDPVGARVWELIQPRRTVREVRDALLREYASVQPEECAADVIALLQDLAGVGLVQVDPA